jgi:hypothetical protein
MEATGIEPATSCVQNRMVRVLYRLCRKEFRCTLRNPVPDFNIKQDLHSKIVKVYIGHGVIKKASRVRLAEKMYLKSLYFEAAVSVSVWMSTSLSTEACKSSP